MDAILQKGLTTKKAEQLLQQYGLNEIKQIKRHTLLLSFFSQFDNFLTILLLLAGIISLLLGEKIDSFFIFLVVILNTLFGVYQEFKAENALKALKNLTISKVRVRRDGQEEELDSRYLVPGDIIFIEEGTKIPADAKVMKSWHLEMNEASLTGESLPVSKNEKDNSLEENTIFAGTVVAKGRAYAQVVKTGAATKFGEIAKHLSEIDKEKTPLQKKLALFTKQLGLIGMIASFTVFLLSFIQNKNLFESFLFAISLAVAAVPEGLPAVMTITLAIGLEKMAKKKAIIRKLNSIETLGSLTLVATDKTGTLTTNQMAVKKVWIDDKTYDITNLPPLTNQPFSKLILNGILCSTATIVFKVDHEKFDVIGDQTEGAILLMSQRMGLIPEMIKNEWEVVDEITFNAKTKRMTVVVKKGDETYVFTKGAPESILAISNRVISGNNESLFDETRKGQIEKEFRQFAKRGLRTMAFSFKKKGADHLESNQIFLGFVGIADPARGEAKEAVEKARQAGIKVIMITGDNELTAEAIGIETGIIKEGEDILTGQQIDAYSDDKLLPVLSKVKIFARISPEHKHRLVKLFQKQGEIVGVTGDGVNDVLALKQADVGITMGITGTDVAKETADMIITDDNFATLINAIDEGRNIFNHIKNVIKYLLTCNTAEVVAVLITVFLGLPPIITALQILYINLVTDGLPALSLAFSPKERDLMKQPPRKTMIILEKKDFLYIGFLGFLGAVVTLGSYLVGRSDLSLARTMAFTTLALIQPLILIDLWLSRRVIVTHFRLLKHPIFIIAFLIPFFIHPFLIYHPFLQQLFKTTPLSPPYFFFSFILSLLILIPIEIGKMRTKVIKG